MVRARYGKCLAKSRRIAHEAGNHFRNITAVRHSRLLGQHFARHGYGNAINRAPQPVDRLENAKLEPAIRPIISDRRTHNGPIRRIRGKQQVLAARLTQSIFVSSEILRVIDNIKKPRRILTNYRRIGIDAIGGRKYVLISRSKKPSTQRAELGGGPNHKINDSIPAFSEELPEERGIFGIADDIGDTFPGNSLAASGADDIRSASSQEAAEV